MDLQVGGLGAAVEVQREVVRREDLAERHRGRVRGDRRDPAVVDAELLERAVQIGTEGIVAGAGDDGRGAAEPGGGDRHVGGRTAEKLAEGLNLRQGYARLQRIEIDPDATHRDQIETRY
ncbi:hypothetical protein RKD32_006457 [Streptomyces sp. SAI-195]